jgi:uncharacterized protein (TIRG00374 family)
VKRFGVWLLKLSVAIGILTYVFTKIPIAEVFESISKARVPHILMGGILVVPALYLAAARLKILTDHLGMSVSILRIVEINLISNFFGLLWPGVVAGGVVRWYQLRVSARKGAEALVAIVCGRLIHTLTLATLAMVFLLLDASDAVKDAVAPSLLGLLAVLFALHVLLFHPALSAVLSQWLQHDQARFIPQPIRARVNKLFAAARQCHSLSFGAFSRLLGVTCAEILLGVITTGLFCQALHLNVSFVTIAWIQLLLFIIILLPISISGLGVREATLLVLLAPYGVSGQNAVALSFLLLAVRLAVAATGGLLQARRVLLASLRPVDSG